jgi:multicomponent Na+:H+ antiporter subunit A
MSKNANLSNLAFLIFGDTNIVAGLFYFVGPSGWIYGAIAAPFIAAALAPFLHGFLRHKAAYVLSLAPLFIFCHFLGYIGPVANGQKYLFSIPWLPTLGINFSFFIDGLSLIFALLISGIGFFIILYAGGYLKGHVRQGRFFSFMLLFMGAMLGLVTADNLITLFVFWELTSITSFLLIGFDHKREASRRAALQALIVTGGGGLFLMAGFILLASLTGTLSMSETLSLGSFVTSHDYYVPVLLLVLGGAFTKSAQVPFHFWLPNAMEAPTPVSAYLHSATMVKAGVYLLMRMNPILGDTLLWSLILPVFGGLTLLTGAILALRQTDLKLMLAYTTVASLGLLVALTGTSSEKVIMGAALYLIAHSLFKGALFMVAGTIDHEAGTRDVTKLGGLRKLMPITFGAALLAALSMSGLPPFVGFLAKEYMYKGTAYPDLAGVLLTITLVIGNAMMFAVAFAVALKPFLGALKETPKKAHEGPFMLYAGPVALALTGLIAGIMAHSFGLTFIAPLTSAITNHQADVDLHLWAGFNLPLLLSGITVALGLVFYFKLDQVRGAIAGGLHAIGWGPDKGFDQFMRAMLSFAVKLTHFVHQGRMDVYMTITFVLVALSLFTPMIMFSEWPQGLSWPSMAFYEWGILGLGFIGLVSVLIAKNRLNAIVSLGIQGFAVALIFMLFAAPDLSFTQFMVETLSVVILALVMTRLPLMKPDRRSTSEMIKDGSIALACGLGFMMVLMSVLSSPLDLRLSDFFAQYSYVIAHGRNIVNVILVDFRGVDTYGEIAVVMIAGLCILVMMRFRSKNTDEINLDLAGRNETGPHPSSLTQRSEKS